MAEEKPVTDENVKIERQAVVVIHGMGEQRPTDTLRNFVNGIKSVLGKRIDGQSIAVWSKPDSIGDIYETIRLSMSSTSSRVSTDFYEFYWAHNMRGTNFGHMAGWMHRLMFTWVKRIPAHLKKLWYTVWGALVVVGIVAIVVSWRQSWPVWKQWAAPVLSLALTPVVLSLLGTFAKSLFLNTAGDAARYFTPSPDNIAERSNIRQQGIKFLKKLHELAAHEKVDRIVIVAHSLGSVVAYDLLRLLWAGYSESHNSPLTVSQDYVEEMNKCINAEKEIGEDGIDAFQQLQHDCWKEQRKLGNKWLVTDFITLGAALNALDYFMVTNVPVAALKTQRELPVCPPVKDIRGKDFYKNVQYKVKDMPRTIKLLNYGAMFAVTRWTNIHYTSDFVGGDMRRVFGSGIRDIAIPRKSLWIYPGGHTGYWDENDKQNALEQIVQAMRLDKEKPRKDVPAEPKA